MIEYDHEPVRGLPAPLPEDEEILWQGAPDMRVLARTALHTRLVLVYFLLLVAFAIASGSLGGALGTALAGAAGVGLLFAFAWAVSRTTVYTLTNKRLVLRIGVALNKCINLPLAKVGAADLRPLDAGHGDIALTLTGRHRLGYLMLWPHVRPWRVRAPEPMLRAVPEAEDVAEKLARAAARLTEVERCAEQATGPAGRPELQGAAA